MWALSQESRARVGEVDIVIQGVLEKRGQLLSQWLPRRLYLTTQGALYSTRNLEYGGLIIRSRRVFDLKLLGQIRGTGKPAVVESGPEGKSKASVFALDIECPDSSHRQLALRATGERDMRRWLTCLKSVRARRLSCVDKKVAQSPSSYLSAFSGHLKLAAVDEDEEGDGDVGGVTERFALPRKVSDTGEFVDDCELPATTLAKQVKAAGQVSLMSMLYDSDDEEESEGGGSGGNDARDNVGGRGREEKDSSSIISFVAGAGATSSSASSSKSGGDQGSVSSETKGGDDGGSGKENASPSFSPRRSSIFDFVADLGKVASLSLGASALGRGTGGSPTDFDFGRSSMRPYVERINAFKKGLRETRKRIKELRKRAVELVELPFAEQQRREVEADKKDKKRDGSLLASIQKRLKALKDAIAALDKDNKVLAESIAEFGDEDEDSSDSADDSGAANGTASSMQGLDHKKGGQSETQDGTENEHNKNEEMKRNTKASPIIDPAKTSALRMRINLRNDVHHRLADVTSTFFRAEAMYRKALKECTARRVRALVPEATESEISEAIFEHGGIDQYIKATIVGQRDLAQLRDAYENARAKRNDMLQLENELMELHSMFVDMNTLVQEQGALINNIEANVQASGELLGAGMDVLAKLSKGRRGFF